MNWLFSSETRVMEGHSDGVDGLSWTRRSSYGMSEGRDGTDRAADPGRTDGGVRLVHKSSGLLLDVLLLPVVPQAMLYVHTPLDGDGGEAVGTLPCSGRDNVTQRNDLPLISPPWCHACFPACDGARPAEQGAAGPDNGFHRGAAHG